MSAPRIESVRVVRGSRAAGAVLDPARLHLLNELQEPASASELARRLSQPRQRVNYHLRELEKAGLVRLVAERKKGNCTERVVQSVARSFLVSPEVLGAMSADPSKIADRASSAYFVAVAGEVIRDVGILRERAAAAGKKVPTLTAQTEIQFESAGAMNAFAEEVTGLLARLAAKYHRAGAPASSVGSEPASAPEGPLLKVYLGGYPALTRDDEAAAANERAT